MAYITFQHTILMSNIQFFLCFLFKIKIDTVKEVRLFLLRISLFRVMGEAEYMGKTKKCGKDDEKQKWF